MTTTFFPSFSVVHELFCQTKLPLTSVLVSDWLQCRFLCACAIAALVFKVWGKLLGELDVCFITVKMITAVLSSVLTGLLALLVYQRVAYPFFWADLMFYLRLQRYKRTVQARMHRGVVTYLDCFLQQAKRNPTKPFIIFEHQTLTYQDVDRRSNRIARAFRTGSSLKQGDIVALLMCNEPDFICVWLGLCKLGCEVAFINTNVRAKALLHCFRSCGARTLVVGPGKTLFELKGFRNLQRCLKFPQGWEWLQLTVFSRGTARRAVSPQVTQMSSLNKKITFF